MEHIKRLYDSEAVYKDLMFEINDLVLQAKVFGYYPEFMTAHKVRQELKDLRYEYSKLRNTINSLRLWRLLTRDEEAKLLTYLSGAYSEAWKMLKAFYQTIKAWEEEDPEDDICKYEDPEGEE